MKRIWFAVVIVLISIAGISAWAGSGVISPLVVIPSTGVGIPSEADIRMYSAPIVLGSVFFDGKTTNAYTLSSQLDRKKIMTTDSAGNAVTYVDSDALAGISLKSGIMYGDKVAVVIDYYPGGGASASGLYSITKDGISTKWNLSKDHGGSNFVIPGMKNNLFLPAALPPGILMQTGISAKTLKSNYSFGPVGNIFFNPDGNLYAFTSSPNRKMLAKIASSFLMNSVAELLPMIDSHLLKRYWNISS